MNGLTLERLLPRVRELPSLSEVVLDVLHSFDDANVNVQTLVDKIGRDQGLAARVLRVANSAFYGLPSRVGSINEAVVVLGFHGVRSLAVAAGIINQFPPSDGKVFDRMEFWRHAIGAGAAAKVLAARLGQEQEVAFTAGLLHDIGKLVLDACFHEEFERVLAYRDAENCTMSEAERETLGLTHAAIGYEVARQWKFPPAIQAAIRDHHDPDAAAPRQLTDIVHLANVLSYVLEIGNAGETLVPSLAPGAWERLGLGWEGLKTCFREVERLNASINLLVEE